MGLLPLLLRRRELLLHVLPRLPVTIRQYFSQQVSQSVSKPVNTQQSVGVGFLPALLRQRELLLQVLTRLPVTTRQSFSK